VRVWLQQEALGNRVGCGLGTGATFPVTPARAPQAHRLAERCSAARVDEPAGAPGARDPSDLARAWERVKENKGAGGVDGVTVTRFDEESGALLRLIESSVFFRGPAFRCSPFRCAAHFVPPLTTTVRTSHRDDGTTLQVNPPCAPRVLS